MMEVYVSECCGGLFVPGYGPDNIHEAEAGTRLTLETADARKGDRIVRGAQDHVRCTRSAHTATWELTYRVTRGDARLYDAMRAGDCPNCGESVPGLDLVAEVGASPRDDDHALTIRLDADGEVNVGWGEAAFEWGGSDE